MDFKYLNKEKIFITIGIFLDTPFIWKIDANFLLLLYALFVFKKLKSRRRHATSHNLSNEEKRRRKMRRRRRRRRTKMWSEEANIVFIVKCVLNILGQVKSSNGYNNIIFYGSVLVQSAIYFRSAGINWFYEVYGAVGCQLGGNEKLNEFSSFILYSSVAFDWLPRTILVVWS